MKRLILLRHGKAADHWEDFARPLSTKGKGRGCVTSSKVQSYKDFLPQSVICSEAERTKQTFEIFQASVPSRVMDTVFVQTLYSGSMNEVAKTIGKIDDRVDNLLIVGHNPLISELATLFSLEDISLGTANAALFESQSETASWKDVLSQTWRLESIVRPD